MVKRYSGFCLIFAGIRTRNRSPLVNKDPHPAGSSSGCTSANNQKLIRTGFQRKKGKKMA